MYETKSSASQERQGYGIAGTVAIEKSRRQDIDTPVRSSELATRLSNLSITVSAAEERLSQLQDRLVSVSREHGPTCQQDKRSPESITTEVGNMIFNIESRVSNLVDRISDSIDRLET